MMYSSRDIFRLKPGSDYYFDPAFDFLRAVQMAWQYQSHTSSIFHQFVAQFNKAKQMDDLSSLPFLPIESFKHHHIVSGEWAPEKIFRSSGTTSSQRSQHLVASLSDYQKHTIRIFENYFGALSGYRIFALLPNYLEAGDSSLVSMVEGFLQYTGQKENGFYLYNFSQLRTDLQSACAEGQKVLLIGVTFALLDFALEFPVSLQREGMVIETGGMKGRGEELSRAELHDVLADAFQTRNIYSEYGMTELMSQAYSDFTGRFFRPPSMWISIREINDPMQEVMPGKIGLVNIVDLANINTCSFIATSDLGRKNEDGSFEIIGRLDHSDIRGCHLLYLDR